MSKQKILITGGLGFIGNSIACRLVGEGHQILIVDNRSNIRKKPAFRNFDLDWVQCDIRNKRKLEEIVADFSPDIISHHAAHISVSNSIKDPKMDATVNIEGTLNLLEFAVKHRIRQFIFASSGGAVYGNKSTAFKETDPSHPTNPYGIAKLSAEQYVQFYANTHGLSTCILRYANIYGPGQFDSLIQGVIVKFIIHAIETNTIEIWGDGMHSRDYVCIDDVVRANVAVIAKKSTGTFNIGSGKKTTTLQVARLVQKFLGKDIEVVHRKLFSEEVETSRLNAGKAQAELSWKAEINLEMGIKSTYEQIIEHLDSRKKYS